MGTIASQITSLTIVYSTVYSDADQRKHQSSASLAFVRGIHRSPVNSPHKWPVTRKMFPFDDVIMKATSHYWIPRRPKHVILRGVAMALLFHKPWNLMSLWHISFRFLDHMTPSKMTDEVSKSLVVFLVKIMTWLHVIYILWLHSSAC